MHGIRQPVIGLNKEIFPPMLPQQVTLHALRGLLWLQRRLETENQRLQRYLPRQSLLQRGMRHPRSHESPHHFRPRAGGDTDHPPRRTGNLHKRTERVFPTGEQGIPPGFIKNDDRFAIRNITCRKARALNKAQSLQGEEVLRNTGQHH